MATKLVGLTVTSVDFVDRGANQDAYVCLCKRHEQAAANIQKEVTETMKFDQSKMTPQELATLEDFQKRYGMPDDPNPVPPGAGGVTKSESGTGEGGEGAGAASMPTPASATPAATGTPAQVPASAIASLPEDFGKGMPGTADPASNPEMHPEVAKALADFRELAKRQAEEVEELKKSLEVERLTAYAKKYEILGKDSAEVAGKLYEFKKGGGTLYDDYVALLDEQVAVVEKSGLFREIGSSRTGGAGTTQEIGAKSAEIAKGAQGMTSAEAIVKAFEENPELAAQYEAEYMGR